MFYEALPRLTKVNDEREGFFNFFHVEVTHNPWGIPMPDGRFVQTDNVGVLKWMIMQLNSYFKWMKDNGVYDNTRIVLVSDHGLVNMRPNEYDPANDPIRNQHLWGKLTKGVRNHWMLQKQKIQMLNCLLAVKDYNDRGKLKCDGRLMSNADLRDLLESVSIAERASQMPQEREAYVVVPPADGSGIQWHKSMDIILSFIIKDNVFDLANWRRVK